MTPGQYTMTAEVPGLKTMTLSDLSLGETPFQLDVTLQTSEPQASFNPSTGECGPTSGPNRLDWCKVLHRAR
jgi:hypothetical protein